MRYLPLTSEDRAAMLGVIGASSIDDLFADVPAEARLDGPIEGLPMHASELAVERHMAALARQNRAAGDGPFFLGAGAYRHHVPASVDHLIQRGEFLTAYTPYQPEIAQGTLQMLFEFQSQVARLLGTGLMLIRRDVVETLGARHPELAFRTDARDRQGTGVRESVHALFLPEIDPSSGLMLSEDYAFCRRARDAGFRIWLAPWVRTTHSGPATFRGSLADLAPLFASSSDS